MKWAIVFSAVIFTAGMVFSALLLVEGLKSDDLDIKGISINMAKMSASMDNLRKDFKPMQVYVTNIPEVDHILFPQKITNIFEKIEQKLPR